MRYVEAPAVHRPAPGDPPSVFLAGGITHCPPWQAAAARALADFVVLNPRRTDFDVSDPSQTDIQIAWEYRHLGLADVTLFWFPACDASLTVQPITLYELGAAAATAGRRLVVGADPGYPRAADVRTQLRLARPDLTVHPTLSATLAAARDALTG
ncbi:nucleoside 2-deoxyribosyltransferase domain-containing protein [Streptomyces sp. ISL-43]|uniref:nucleoside 2-deoxyribosyltransferase domain-containing protein n=1 Tax=Streptomyces sp. ISL-43 TaxID=2819183 RepID=UPI001BE8E835|nr:nucleoside 2-deoxyribosyltransferase domain-containing protein [Streptomyces sp. ISL-43]MBT2451656.1 nucleoside 2-deoxyribosyltransferase domain-containing protein [Streptomyces sp. ISL-43]